MYKKLEQFLFYMKHFIAFLICMELADLSAAAESIVRIGWSGPLSGNSAVLGIDSVEAVRIAVEEFNLSPGRHPQVELLVEDDQYDTAKAVSAYSKFVSSNVQIVFASTYGGVFATAERAQRDGVLVLNPLDCNDEIARLPSNTLCLATQSESVGSVLAQAIRSHSLDPTLVIFDERNPFMSLVSNVIKKELQLSEKNVLGIDQQSADFRSILSPYSHQSLGAIILLGHDPMGDAMRRARELKLAAQFLTVGTITSPGFQAAAGEAAEGTLVAYWQAPASKELQAFLQKFKSRVGRLPYLQLASVPSYDAATLTLKCLREVSGSVDQLKSSILLRCFLNTKSFEGISGLVRFDDDGAVRSIREGLFQFSKGSLIRESDN